jgi:hypothetical protein
MKIGIGVQALLRFCLSSLRGCNVGITDARDLCSTSFRWTQVAWYNIPSLMTVGYCTQVILSFLPQQSERLKCRHYRWEGLVNYSLEMALGGMVYIPGFIKVCSCVHIHNIYIDTQTRRLCQKPTFICQNKESEIKVVPVLHLLSSIPWRPMGEWRYRPTYSWPRQLFELSVSFTLRPFYSRGKSPRNHWIRGWLGPRTRLGRRGLEKTFASTGTRTSTSKPYSP